MTGGNLIIRFDRNFNTKFKPRNTIRLSCTEIIDKNFFVLPYSIIEKLYQKVIKDGGHTVQGLHDELLLYLYRQPIKEAEERERKYPPYPDIWGYDFSVYSPSTTYMLTDQRGDFVFQVIPSKKRNDYGVMMYHLFSNNEVRLGKSYSMEYKQYNKKNKLRPGPEAKNYIVFKDESTIEYECDGTYDMYADDRLKNCFIKKEQPNLKKTKQNSKKEKGNIEQFSVFSIEANVQSGGKREFELCQVPIFTKLEDETFLLNAQNCSIVLRFDKDMKTKFKPQNKVDLGGGKILNSNFFVLPYTKVQYFYDHILKGYMGKQTQAVTSHFLNYLYDEQQKSNL